MSVVLCTYNGGAYLAEQLASIADQTFPPDEIVVRDDGSTDGTRLVLDEFARSSAIPVTITENTTRLGVPGNFWAAIDDANGELLALCDQDDIWEPTRIEHAVSILNADAGVGATFSDGVCIDGHGVTTGQRLWEAAGFTEDELEKFRSGNELSVLLTHNVVTGASLTFRSRFRSSLTPWPAITHDYWIAAGISLQARVHAIEEPLIRYRLHPANTIGFIEAGMVAYVRQLRHHPEHRQRWMTTQVELSQSLLALEGQTSNPRISPDQHRFIARQLELVQFRRHLPRQFGRRAPQVVARVRRGDYRVAASGPISWVRDLFHP